MKKIIILTIFMFEINFFVKGLEQMGSEIRIPSLEESNPIGLFVGRYVYVGMASMGNKYILEFKFENGVYSGKLTMWAENNTVKTEEILTDIIIDESSHKISFKAFNAQQTGKFIDSSNEGTARISNNFDQLVLDGNGTYYKE